MAFKQYTKCIEPDGYTDFNHMLVATFQSLLVGVTGSAIVLATHSKPFCWALVGLVVGLAWVIAYCRLFLYQRLICLGGDRDAIGVVVTAEHSPAKEFPDNDYSVNLLLQDNEFGDKRPKIEVSFPYGYLVHAQDKITARGLPTQGHEAKDKATGKVSEVLHAEFEGPGAYALLIASEVGFAAAVAALILCVYLPPIPYLQVIIYALAILALLALLLGALIGLGTSGSPSDIDSNQGDFHVNDADNNGMGSGADVIYVFGTWVYDPWHVGWNEIHPVKVCTKIGTWEGDWNFPPDVILRLRTQFELATDEATKSAQAQPQNQWVVHPSIDGCSTVVIL